MIFGLLILLSLGSFISLLISLLVFGFGYLLALILPLTQMEASSLFFASLTLLVLTCIFMMLISQFKNRYFHQNLGDILFDNLDEDLEDEKQKKIVTEDMSASQQKNDQSEKIGRNQSCPCGSGKKFKFCCSQKSTVLSLHN